MKLCLLFCLCFCAATQIASAQHFGVQRARFANPGSLGGAILQAQDMPADDTFYFPTTGGTLVTDASFSGWLVGGQNLGATGLLGSWNAYDVSLISGGTDSIRLSLLSGEHAVLLPAQTELRLGDASGGEYSALMSPTTLDSSFTYIFPDSLPAESGQRFQVQSLSGSTVTIGYTTVEKSTDVSFDTKQSATATSNDNTNPVNVTDMSISVEPDKTYAFEAVVSFQWTGQVCSGVIRFVLPSGASLHYYHTDLLANNAATEGNLTEAWHTYAAPVAPAESHYILKGFVRTNGNGGVVQMQLASSNAGREIVLTNNSYMQITTN